MFIQFLEDFQCFISSGSTFSHDFRITGDLNVNVEDPSGDYSRQFLSVLIHANSTQRALFLTHRLRTFYLIITTAG